MKSFFVWCFSISFVLMMSSVAGHGSSRTPLVMSENWRAENNGNSYEEPIQPLPQTGPSGSEKQKLGESLFKDPILSQDQTVSCMTCHDLKRGGADGRKMPVGIGGAQGEVNTPSVFNAGFNFRQFWDGRALSLEQQIDGPILNPREMAMTWPEVIHRLEKEKKYKTAFKAIYPAEGISEKSIKDAIASFERSLITPNSRFDRFLRGEAGLLTAEEKSGYSLFKELGCISCHQGVGIGGNMFQVFGVMEDYFKNRSKEAPLTKADLGRFNITKDERDRHVFKVPSLRNVALTAPYFHDGSAATLEDAVRTMGRYQLGRELSSDEIHLISAFLRTLNGTYQGVGL